MGGPSLLTSIMRTGPTAPRLHRKYLKCRPTRKARPESSAEARRMQNCIGYLLEQMESFKNARGVALGQPRSEVCSGCAGYA